MPGQGEVLTNGAETGKKRLGALRVAKALHLALTSASRLMGLCQLKPVVG